MTDSVLDPKLTSPLTVVVVEDHQMTRLGLKTALSQTDDMVCVGEASDAQEAFAQVAEHQPDVVLMDIGLPGIDGVEATQRIKKDHPDIKIMMLTANDEETTVFAALGAGADAYCMKGVDPETLHQAIVAVAEGTAWLDPAIARVVLGRFAGNAASQMSLAKPTIPEDCPLTKRELEVLGLIVEGLSNPKIADRLVVTEATAKAHVHNILQKLCVTDRTQAAVLAMRQGLV